MRFATIAVLLASVALAGCGGGSDDPTLTTTTTGGTNTNTTTLPPNVPPVIVAVVTVDGAAGNVTKVGGNVTVDVSGTTDPDGDGLSIVAVVAQDRNQTYPTQFVYDNGAFRTATFTLDSAGITEISVAAVDKRSGSSTYTTRVYVNQALSAPHTFTLLAPPSPGSTATDCAGPSGQGAVDPAMWGRTDFPVRNGTTFVTAKVVSGQARIAICEPSGTAISGESNSEVTSNDGALFQEPLPGGPSYFVSVLSDTANQSAVVEVTVHYEPAA